MIHDGGDRIWCRTVQDRQSPLLGDEWRWIKNLTGGPGGSILIRSEVMDPELAVSRAKKGKKKTKKQPPAVQGGLDGKQAEKYQQYQSERSRKFKALIAGRGLNHEDTESLLRRGLDREEIQKLNELGFVSVDENVRCVAAAGAPGVTDEGAYVGPKGFLIPAYRKVNGKTELLGFQVSKCAELKGDGGKYVWLSLGADKEDSRHHHALSVINADGSLDSKPLFSHIGGDKVERAYLCDGALKTYVTALRQKQAAFGAPGAVFSASMGQLRERLSYVCGLNSEVKIVIAADGGDTTNNPIMVQLASVANAIREWGYQITWVDLKQEKGKKDGEDVDEINAVADDLVHEYSFFQKMRPGLQKKVRKALAQKWERGFRPLKESDELEPQLSTENPVLFKKGERTAALAELIKKGSRVVLDASATGAGKSYWWSHLDETDLEALGVEQVAVLSERYLEQAEEFGMPMVRGRQAQGVKRTAEGRLFTIPFGEELGPEETQAFSGNCIMGSVLDKFQKRNMGSALGSLCTQCPHRDGCEVTGGAYRYDRAAALLEPVVVMHPRSMQEQFVLQSRDAEEGGIALPRTGVILDDVAMETLLDTVTVNKASVEESLKSLGEQLSHTSGIDTLKNLVGRSKSTEPQKLKEECLLLLQSEIPHRWPGFIEQEEFEVDKSDGRTERRCWLPLLEAWVKGNAVAHIDENNNLIFKTFNNRLREALASAAWVLFLDATASPLVLERLVGERPEMIAEERWLTPADLNITQVKGLGVLGYSRTPQQNFQLKVALAKLKKAGRLPYESTAVIDTKAGLEISKGYGVVTMGFLSDSRGSNRAYEANCSTLVLIGSPNTNLGSAAATYELLFGEAVHLEARRPVKYEVLQEEGSERWVCCEVGSEHPGFTRFYAHLRRAELLQALGRLRHNIREGESLDVIVLGDSVMPFAVRLQELAEVIDDDNMSDWSACNPETINGAAMALRKEKKPVNFEAVQARTGLHPKLLREWCDAFKPDWLTGGDLEPARTTTKIRRYGPRSRRNLRVA